MNGECAEEKSRAPKPPHDIIGNSDPQKESMPKLSTELPGESFLQVLPEEENVAISKVAVPRLNFGKVVPGGTRAKVHKIYLNTAML